MYGKARGGDTVVCRRNIYKVHRLLTVVPMCIVSVRYKSVIVMYRSLYNAE